MHFLKNSILYKKLGFFNMHADVHRKDLGMFSLDVGHNYNTTLYI